MRIIQRLRIHHRLYCESDVFEIASVRRPFAEIRERRHRLHRAGLNLRRVEHEIEERLGNDRGQAMVLNSLDGVLQRLGKFPEAADALERSTRNVSRSTMRQGLGAC